jgi:uncharacterized protein with NAD-binding domain and iron-sulfur cluster
MAIKMLAPTTKQAWQSKCSDKNMAIKNRTGKNQELQHGQGVVPQMCRSCVANWRVHGKVLKITKQVMRMERTHKQQLITDVEQTNVKNKKQNNTFSKNKMTHLAKPK